MRVDPFCLSAYLAFRFVPDARPWRPGIASRLPGHADRPSTGVTNAQEIEQTLRQLIEDIRLRHQRVGILLSGGIDSAILAALLPEGTPAYTIRFVADGAIDESQQAREYAQQWNLSHRIIDVHWADYAADMDRLMLNKRSPLHAVEVGLYRAAVAAIEDGIDTLILGNGADSNFGGLDKLLAKEWGFQEFVHRYSFIDPASALKEPSPIIGVFTPYRRGDGIDVAEFLREIHGPGVTQAFTNAMDTAGVTMAEPYEDLRLVPPLDFQRIRSGESKYLLRELFRRLYNQTESPEKIAFTRPMDQWLKDWPGPDRTEFRKDVDWSRFSGDQRWLIYCLNRFLELIS